MSYETEFNPASAYNAETIDGAEVIVSKIPYGQTYRCVDEAGNLYDIDLVTNLLTPVVDEGDDQVVDLGDDEDDL